MGNFKVSEVEAVRIFGSYLRTAESRNFCLAHTFWVGPRELKSQYHCRKTCQVWMGAARGWTLDAQLNEAALGLERP